MKWHNAKDGEEVVGWGKANGKHWITVQKEDRSRFHKLIELDEVDSIGEFIGPDSVGYLAGIVADMVELPAEKRIRYAREYGLNDYESNVIITYVDAGDGRTAGILAKYFEEAVEYCGDGKSCFNWITGQLLAFLKEEGLGPREAHITPQMIGELINCIHAEVITTNSAKKVFEKMVEDKLSPHEVIDKYDMVQKDNTEELNVWVDEVINENPKVAEQFRSGKESVMGFFVGQIMKKSKGKANPKKLNDIIKSKLKNS